MKTEQKFKIDQMVLPDVLNKPMRIVQSWWTDKAYGSKNGSWVYRLAFVTKKGEIDKRKHFRQFEENRLTES